MIVRRHTCCRIRVAVVLCLAVAGGFVPSPLFAAARWVKDVIAEKDQWSSYASAGTPMTIEGRISTISGRQLRFRGCDLPFQAAEGKTLIKPFTTMSNVEVSGRFAVINTKPTFVIDSMKTTPSDVETYRRRERELRDAKPDQWYSLGDWVVARGEFYGDDDLKRRSTDAYREAIDRERSALAEDDADGLIKLAEKLPKYGLPEATNREFLHDAWQRRYKKTSKDDPAAIREFAENFAKEFSGCETPLEPEHAKEGAGYLRDPVRIYRNADEPTRNRLHRAFYAHLLKTAILIPAQPDGSNGTEIAAELDELGPEFQELAESYRLKHLELRVSRVKTATRQEVVLLADELRQRQQPERADELLKQWLELRSERLRKDGPTGLMQAAEDYQTLIDDKETAFKLLIEAYEIDPTAEPVSRRLKQMGYELHEGRWLSKKEAAAVPEDPNEVALREGRVIAGMTADQVQKALGSPDAIARFASFNEVNELWTYDNVGRVRLVVHIQRRGTGELRTISVSQVKTPPR